jgi:hypothetical protein
VAACDILDRVTNHGARVCLHADSPGNVHQGVCRWLWRKPVIRANDEIEQIMHVLLSQKRLGSRPPVVRQ